MTHLRVRTVLRRVMRLRLMILLVEMMMKLLCHTVTILMSHSRQLVMNTMMIWMMPMMMTNCRV